MPADAAVRGAAVLCPPLGEEGRAAHRTYRSLAQELASRGFAALRFDYDGCGDSAGRADDPGRPQAWLQSIGHARRYLEESGATSTALVGMRVGATLAAEACVGDLPAALVLWDPCASGRSFLREGQSLYAFAGSGAPPQDGRVHTPGFQYDAETRTALSELKLASALGHVADAPILVLERLIDDSREPRERAKGCRRHDDERGRTGRLVGKPRQRTAFVPGASLREVAHRTDKVMPGAEDTHRSAATRPPRC